MSKFKFKPKPTVNREATEQELECIKKTEEMIKTEKVLPPVQQMVRNIAIEHWRTLKAFIRGKQVVASQGEAIRRFEICKNCPELIHDETNPDTGKRDGRCPLCGCFMNIKVHYATAECPLEKWTKECGHQCDCACGECE